MRIVFICLLFLLIPAVAIVAIAVSSGDASDRRRARLAFRRGMDDANSVIWKDILANYETYLAPMRATDAAAYKRGVERSILSLERLRWEDVRAEFESAWNRREIHREGTEIRSHGKGGELSAFRLDVPIDLQNWLKKHPNNPPRVSVAEFDGPAA